ncbi:type III secretion system outer membrane ring subunit SctC [Trinickia dinghuensis]|uniref:Type 3 secretion system secretin n=1 Tax=Trinickia dinghuensis TaxID=2291023 RepID=A0A3D8K0E0_9BURK|nr:type III secretion system outer membrane ring subunit SctC [Trinickia dinghuensis]RDU98071.1 EscC/YscC/HrcC family type III secretion system outer membrane ring protein [Trinickia dinghuensis]
MLSARARRAYAARLRYVSLFSQLALGALALSCAGALGMPRIAHAAELQWRDRPYTIVADGKKVTDFIRELASAQGVTAVIDSKVDGTISGHFSGSPIATLRSVCATYGLTYYFDGSLLYIDRAEDGQTQVFPIPKGSAGELSRTLEAMQIPDKRYPLIISDRENTIYVSGPQRYVDLVRQAISTITDPSRGLDRAEIRAFPLRYAYATDFQINRSGKEVTIPGVATTLGRLFGKNDGNGGLPGYGARLGGATRQVKLTSGDTVNVPRLTLGAAGTTETPSSDASEAAVRTGQPISLPQIVADAGTNSVIVRDVPEHMPEYAQLISALDARPRLIEVGLTIIDIDESALDSFGVDWRLHTPNGDFQFGDGSNPPLSFSGNTEAGQTGASTPVGMALTASIGGAMRNYLLSRINMLQQKGKAQTLSKPMILTLDNNEAILENLTEFYVQVSGYQDSSLYGITTGTSVKVTPRIVNDGGKPSVMMSIDIDDGELNSTLTVTSVPAVIERNIVTKAMIDEGKSLLIAGFNNDTLTTNKTGIPWISDIPWIGNLFKYTKKNGERTDRFYLLTPRVVQTASTFDPNAAPLGVEPPLPGQPFNSSEPMPNTAPGPLVVPPSAVPAMPPSSTPPSNGMPSNSMPAPGASAEPVPPGDSGKRASKIVSSIPPAGALEH